MTTTSESAASAMEEIDLSAQAADLMVDHYIAKTADFMHAGCHDKIREAVQGIFQQLRLARSQSRPTSCAAVGALPVQVGPRTTTDSPPECLRAGRCSYPHCLCGASSVPSSIERTSPGPYAVYDGAQGMYAIMDKNSNYLTAEEVVTLLNGGSIVSAIACGEWIDAKERQPDSSLQGVIALVREGPYHTYWLAYYFKDRGEWQCVHKAYPKKIDVAFWKPLPEYPPQIDRETGKLRTTDRTGVQK